MYQKSLVISYLAIKTLIAKRKKVRFIIGRKFNKKFSVLSNFLFTLSFSTWIGDRSTFVFVIFWMWNSWLWLFLFDVHVIIRLYFIMFCYVFPYFSFRVHLLRDLYWDSPICWGCKMLNTLHVTLRIFLRK